MWKTLKEYSNSEHHKRLEIQLEFEFYTRASGLAFFRKLRIFSCIAPFGSRSFRSGDLGCEYPEHFLKMSIQTAPLVSEAYMMGEVEVDNLKAVMDVSQLSTSLSLIS